MSIVEPLVLPADVLLVPVAELPAATRRQLTWQEGDYAVTRPRSRTPSRIVDAPGAALLRQFEQPRTVAAAVISYSRERGENPEATLLDAYPLLDGLVRAGFLVVSGSDGGRRIQPSLAAGSEAAGFTVGDCMQSLEDTEIYQARGRGQEAQTAALKIVRPGAPAASPRLAAALHREAAILGHLSAAAAAAGHPEPSERAPLAPHLLAAGAWEERAFLAIEWCGGTDAATAAAELRRSGGAPARRRLLDLCSAIAHAYQRLHGAGVVHGDVHPRNVLVAAGGEVRLIDFGLASWDGLPPAQAPEGRGGIGFFLEPELAAALLTGRSAPATAAGEQHAVAALLYMLWCGVQYLDFSLERGEMLRQIAHDPPLSFASRELEPWPELEAVLRRALSKDPVQRYRSCGELGAALADLAAATALALAPAAHGAHRGRRSAPAGAAERLLGEVLARVEPEGSLWREGLPAPRTSLNYGSAGIAYALHRIALVRDDAALLAQADLWATRAAREARAACDPGAGEPGESEAFYNPRLDLTISSVGRVSPFHTASGPLCVQALIAMARCDAAAARRAAAGLAAVGAVTADACVNPDLTTGRSGLLLAAGLLAGGLGGGAAAARHEALLDFGESILRGLWLEIDALPPILRCGERRNLGVAHGWAGYLFATLQWCRATGRPLPAGVAPRLEELAAAANPWQRGLRWPWYGGDSAAGGEHPAGSMAGWCNGSAGLAQLFALAHRMQPDPTYLRTCEGAAWNAWEAPDRSGSLCCGLAGRAYGLLSLYRLLRAAGDPAAAEWLERARLLADDAAVAIAGESEVPDSLYKGRVGVAVLAADLSRPESSAMPFCEMSGADDEAPAAPRGAL
jgi:hypothetical protein